MGFIWRNNCILEEYRKVIRTERTLQVLLGVVCATTIAFIVVYVSSCNLDKAVKDGISQAGTNAATTMMDKFPEIAPELKDAISGAVVAGVDHVIKELNLKPPVTSGGWIDSILSGIGVVLAYLLGHRFVWIRVVIDYIKGKVHADAKKDEIPTNLTT